MFEKLQKLVGLSEHSLATLQCLYKRKKERKKWRTNLSPKAMGPRAAAGGKRAV
jgi:hypothetical protein